MLILSQGLIKVGSSGEVKTYGVLKSYQREVAEFFQDLPLRNATVRFRDGRLLFSRNVEPALRKQIRNYLFNLPALVRLR